MEREHWVHHDDGAGTGYQLPLQQVDPPTLENPIYAQDVELLQSRAIPAGYQAFDQSHDSCQLPPQPLDSITPDNPIYAQYVSLVQYGAYQIFD